MAPQLKNFEPIGLELYAVNVCVNKNYRIMAYNINKGEVAGLIVLFNDK